MPAPYTTRHRGKHITVKRREDFAVYDFVLPMPSYPHDSLMPSSHDPPESDAPACVLRELSEITSLHLRVDDSVPVTKCIYPRLPLRARDAVRERIFLAWAENDSTVQALGRTSRRHRFVRLLAANGGPRYAMPDFLVRTSTATYLVDVHARRHPAQRLRTLMDWCEWANALPLAWRGEKAWFFAPLAGLPLEDRTPPDGRLAELLAFARARAGYVAAFGHTSRSWSDG